MDHATSKQRHLLEAFDAQIRRHPETESPSLQVETGPGFVRVVQPDQGWPGVSWTRCGPGEADVLIDSQIERFAEFASAWEWKYCSYDLPADLPQRLLARGFVADEEEALMVAEISNLDLDVAPPAGVSISAATDQVGIQALVAVHDKVFGGDNSAVGRELLSEPENLTGFIAVLNAESASRPGVSVGPAISSGRVRFHSGTEFASLWGGGTVAGWRHKGVFSALVSARAALAAQRGFRYLQVDALAMSAPILAKLGFHQIATTTPYHYSAKPLLGQRTANQIRLPAPAAMQ